MHSVTLWFLINLTMHQPLPAPAPYAFATLADCQHAIHALNYRQTEVTCRSMTYVAYGSYDQSTSSQAVNARGERNAAYDLEKLNRIIQSPPPPIHR